MENHDDSLYNSQNKDTNSKPFDTLKNLNNVIDTAMNQSTAGFPISVFPKQTQDLIRNAKETVGFHPDYLSAGILSVVATAIGNSVKLNNGSYTAKPILWLAIVGRRGTGKTHPLQFAKKPLEIKDTEAAKKYQAEWDEYERLDKDKKGKKPIYSKFILKDFTPEKLSDSLQHNDKGIMIFQDELMRWINSFDQYKKGGDQQMYLGLFNGGELTVDRMTREPIRIEETNVNILGGIQPEMLGAMANGSRLYDGFVDRLLTIYPDDLEPILFTGKSIAAVHSENYKRLINNLLDCPVQVIQADTKAIEIYKAWQHQKAAESFNDNVEIAIQAKLETYVWRFALILEMMHQASTAEFNINLSEKSINDAIILAEYFRKNALKIHDRLNSKDPLEDLTAAQRDLYDSLPYNFKRVDVLPLFKEKGITIRTGDRLIRRTDLFYNSDNCKELKYGQYKKKKS